MARLTKNLESQGLSTSRISRLLRPLHTKCTALATLHPTPLARHYGSKPSSAEFHPLDILPPPDSFRSYHIEHRPIAAAIYSVRDCFREIVLKTKTAEVHGSPSRVTRLADLCSIIVGENMQGEEELGADPEADSEQLAEMENLYEIIPVQYRRFALLAHALDIVLRCSRHFTLLSILLDVSLQHDLYHESCVLLHRLLQASVSPASGMGSVLCLCHPAHSNYLVDLFQKWKGAGRPTSVLIRILTEILVKTARPELWRCRALARLARELHNQDFHSLLDMVGHLVQMSPPESARRKLGACGSDLEKISLTDQLNRWLNHSSSSFMSHSPDLTSILEFLERCRQSGVHQNADALAATVVCWATHYLSVTTPSIDTHSSISRLLGEVVSPTVTMYNLLVEKSFGIKEASMIARLQDSKDVLQAYASCLRSENLLLLEASLWACILRFVETSMDFLVQCGTRKDVSLYREELMDLVDDAERRCFGSGLHVVGAFPCSEATETGWRWEEIPGCWVECHLPARKKAKHHSKVEHRYSRGFASNPRSSLQNVNRTVVHHPLPSSLDLSFKSLVSSALSNRTQLHGHSVSRQTSGARTPTPHDRGIEPTLLRTCQMRENFDVPAPSDDALDLFAYTEIPPISHCIQM
ncbi:hypothetical protein C8R44DRAFT_781787 [Mycena epipterygia]|nr:hypothetical protein C8R44DRAFT_781787 [Mycena epipterygia]